MQQKHYPPFLLFLLLVCWVASTAFSQVLPGVAFGTNGSVHAALRAGNKLYVGGEFSYVGRNIRFAATVNNAIGLPGEGFAEFNGPVMCAIPDGQGGWYVGGGFTRVGAQVREHLAQINSNGQLTPWNPGTNGLVATLALSEGVVYAGGSFYVVNGNTSRNFLASFDAATGALTAWNPGADNYVSSLVISGGLVYAGGDFITVNGSTPRNHLAALDATTGIATAWNPNINDNVSAVIVSGSTVYAGGSFSTVNGGTGRNGLAAFDATGTAIDWNPNVNGLIKTMLLNGMDLYIGGTFSHVNGGTTRHNLAVLNAATGIAGAWNPNVNGTVNALALSDTSLYAGGSFSLVKATIPRRHGAAFSTAANAAVLPWKPEPHDPLRALATQDNRVFVGGDFWLLNVVRRNSLAAFEYTTGQPTEWNPNINSGNMAGTVYSLANIGPYVYAGGEFLYVNDSVGRSYLAAFDTLAGTVSSWDPQVTGGNVLALATSGSRLYVGGEFGYVSGSGGTSVLHPRLAAFDTTSSAALPWNPSVDGGVEALTVKGDQVYAGGHFWEVNFGNGIYRNRLASFDTVLGTATDWNPDIGGGWESVWAMKESNGQLYVGGDFTTVNGGIPRNNLAAFDMATGTALPWNPDVDGPVFGMAIVDSVVYAGGNFLTANGGLSRSWLAAFDTGAGTALNWLTGMDGPVYTVYSNESHLYAGGYFTTVDTYRYARHLAALQPYGAIPQSVAVLPSTAPFTVYPQPVVSRLHITGYSRRLAGESAIIHNMLGTVVAQTNLEEHETIVNASAWPPGMYIVRLPDGTTAKVSKR